MTGDHIVPAESRLSRREERAAELERERESGRAKMRARIAAEGGPFLGAAVVDEEPF